METGLKDFEVARLKAMDFTRATGLEYGLIMDAQGHIEHEVKGHLGEELGVLGYVDFSEVVKSEDEVKGKWMLHSHPDDSAFSLQDIWVAWTSNARGAIVFGREGSVYKVEGLEDVKLGERYLGAVQDWATMLAGSLVYGKGLSVDESQVATSHIMIKRLGEDVGFRYTYELSDSTKVALRKVGEAYVD